jgi:uncharacterized protein
LLSKEVNMNSGDSILNIQGVGLGLRWPLIESILEESPRELSWLEVAPENYMGRGGRFRNGLDKCLAKFPVVTHGLALSLGGPDALDTGYLAGLREFTQSVQTPWHSDHLCFSVVDGVATHELLPLAFNEAMVGHVADRIKRAQDALGMPLAVENVSSYGIVPGSVMREEEFVSAVIDRADCGLLLDVNNVYVNSKNHKYDPRAMLRALPLDRVWQLHVAGHEKTADGNLLDTHGERVCEEVFELLEWTLAQTGPKPVLLERDGNFPDWNEIVGEVRRIAEIGVRAEGSWRIRMASTLPMTELSQSQNEAP